MPQFAPKQIYDVHESFNRSLRLARLERGEAADGDEAGANHIATRKFLGWSAIALIALLAAGWAAFRGGGHGADQDKRPQAAGVLDSAN